MLFRATTSRDRPASDRKANSGPNHSGNLVGGNDYVLVERDVVPVAKMIKVMCPSAYVLLDAYVLCDSDRSPIPSQPLGEVGRRRLELIAASIMGAANCSLDRLVEGAESAPVGKAIVCIYAYYDPRGPLQWCQVAHLIGVRMFHQTGPQESRLAVLCRVSVFDAQPA